MGKIVAILFFCCLSLNLFAQDNSDSTNFRLIHGRVLFEDSTPVFFPSVYTTRKNRAYLDTNGCFTILINPSVDTILTVGFTGHKTKKIDLRDLSSDSLILFLEPGINDEDVNRKFASLDNPRDTVYYRNGKTKEILYRSRDKVVYNKNGSLKTVLVDGNIRTYYCNGQLKYQSVSIHSHSNLISTWYKNGQKKSEGYESWSIEEAKWIKGNNWIYWRKNGEKK